MLMCPLHFMDNGSFWLTLTRALAQSESVRQAEALPGPEQMSEFQSGTV